MWRHAPRASPKWPVPQAGHLGLTQEIPWIDVKAIRTYRGQTGGRPREANQTHPVSPPCKVYTFKWHLKDLEASEHKHFQKDWWIFTFPTNFQKYYLKMYRRKVLGKKSLKKIMKKGFNKQCIYINIIMAKCYQAQYNYWNLFTKSRCFTKSFNSYWLRAKLDNKKISLANFVILDSGSMSSLS